MCTGLVGQIAFLWSRKIVMFVCESRYRKTKFLIDLFHAVCTQCFGDRISIDQDLRSCYTSVLNVSQKFNISIHKKQYC